VATFPYAIHTVQTDNGAAFADFPKSRDRYLEISTIFGGHIFDRFCGEHGIEHTRRVFLVSASIFSAALADRFQECECSLYLQPSEAYR
jgi:hypothetical protein